MKGQWFVISSIFVAFSMFVISSDLRSFRSVDTAGVAGYSEQQHFANLKSGLQRTIQLSPGTCGALQKSLDEYIYFAQQSKGRLGYAVDVFYDIEDCAAKKVRFDLILLQSERYQLWEGIRPAVGAG